MAFSDTDPLEEQMGIRTRFWMKVRRSSGCWLWTGAVSGVYGQFWDGKRVVWAHRFSYELKHGSIPPRKQIDHRPTCPKNCVNPDHLRVATNKQNQENRAGPQRGSRSGVRGVHWHPATSQWRAQVGHKGRKVHVGLFSDIADAEAAVVAKRLELFTHNDADRMVP